MEPLLVLFLTPLITSLCTLFLKNQVQRKAFVLSLLPLAMLLAGGSKWLQSDINYPWLSALSIYFHIGVDNLSFIFLYLVSVIIPISILAPNKAEIERKNVFYALILLTQALLTGLFVAKDLALFTFFFEAILIPLYFILSLWGGKEKQKASFIFIIYMIAGSCLMVAAVLSLYALNTTFDISSLASATEKPALLGAIFLLAFSVKTPLFPFHSWLPLAYAEAPTSGTILLSALLSKAGIYGILRILFGIFPEFMVEWSPYLLQLAIIGVLYGAFAAWGQSDFKKLIAYSSFSHVNFVLAGLFVYNEMAHSGAILGAVNHAITITGLFLVAGWLEIRLGTTRFGEISGLAAYVPRLAWLTLFFVLSAVALPGLNNFVSEAMLLYGVFNHNPWCAALLGLTVIFSVIYMLRWLHSVYFETPHANERTLVDIKSKEMLIALPLIALILWLGIYPSTALAQVTPAAEKTLKQIKAS
jgi:NADH-quinone oxidoreductase subunit M